MVRSRNTEEDEDEPVFSALTDEEAVKWVFWDDADGPEANWTEHMWNARYPPQAVSSAEGLMNAPSGWIHMKNPANVRMAAACFIFLL